MHTTPPPELVIPSKRDLLFFRADFAGVTIPGTYTPTASADIIAHGGCTITSGRWNGLFIPYINGANTTPPTMILTEQLVLYPRKVQDCVLTLHAERNYSHMITSGTDPWENPPISIQQAIAWGKYLKSWGFLNVIWQGDPTIMSDWGPLVDADVCNFGIVGEEVDNKVTAEQYCAILNVLRAGPLNGIPSGAHFTAGEKGGYPVSFPRDTFILNWADYNGWLHLMLQSNQNHSAGRQGAVTTYARQRVNLGGIGGDGRPAPDSRIVLFETMASAQFMGICTEEYGCLRSLEMLYCPATDPRMPMFGGSGNGLRNHEGSVL